MCLKASTGVDRWRDAVQKGGFSKNFKHWFHFQLERKKSFQMVARTFLDEGYENIGIVENCSLSDFRNGQKGAPTL